MRTPYSLLFASLFLSFAAQGMPDVTGKYTCKSESYRNPSELTFLEKDEQLFIEGLTDEVTQGLFCQNGEAQTQRGQEHLAIKAQCDDQTLAVTTTSTLLQPKTAITTQIRITRLSAQQTEIWYSFKIKKADSEKAIEVKALCDRQSSAG